MATEPGAGRRPWPVRWAVAFGRFWWEFLVGDTPELLIGAVVAVGAVALLCTVPAARTWAALVLPAAVAVVLGLSVARAARTASRPTSGAGAGPDPTGGRPPA